MMVFETNFAMYYCKEDSEMRIRKENLNSQPCVYTQLPHWQIN
jgi:hypothetical protein